MAVATATLLDARGLSKEYPPTRALHRVDFSIAGGQIHTVAGENGSGKSTLIKILAGVVVPDEGTVAIDGEEMPTGSVRAARDRGIALVTQEGTFLPDLTVAENIFLGRRHVVRHGRIDWGATRRAAAAVLDRLELDIDPGRSLRDLASDGRQLVEIARAMSFDARVLLLDEATSSLDQNEVANVFAALRRIRASGVGIVFVSHRMAEMFELSDAVTVLRDGRFVDRTDDMAQIDETWLVQRMVGRDLTTFEPREASGAGDVVLDVRGLSDRRGAVHEASLEVRRGEIVGLGGLVGAGRTELLELIIGARARAGGEILVEGRPLKGGPANAIRRGVTLLTEDRAAKGVVPEMSVRDNMLLNPLQRRTGIRRRQAEMATLGPWLEELGVRGAGANAPIASLSGGNQQKVLLGRCLLTKPKVILLDEPTRGIDIGAKAEIGQMISRLADQGAAVLVASSELPELLAICDRVVVMRAGHIVAGLDRSVLTEERILEEALGGMGK